MNPDLTPRQREIMRFIGEGLTDAEIAPRLKIRRWGVRWHVREIFRKLAASSRSEALKKTLQLSVVEKTPPPSSITA